MKGIENCCWEGRMEEVLPEVFLDGAHNQEGIEAFLETVRQDGCLGRRYLVFGAVQDKEVGKIAHKLEYSGLFSCIHTVDLQNERGMKAKRLRTFFNDIEIIVEEGTRQALENVLFLQEEGDRIYFVGSLYLVGEVKSLLSTEKISQ
jgi:dihydrofolate synthase/folylpolyglutamate synthase